MCVQLKHHFVSYSTWVAPGTYWETLIWRSNGWKKEKRTVYTFCEVGLLLNITNSVLLELILIKQYISPLSSRRGCCIMGATSVRYEIKKHQAIARIFVIISRYYHFGIVEFFRYCFLATFWLFWDYLWYLLLCWADDIFNDSWGIFKRFWKRVWQLLTIIEACLLCADRRIVHTSASAVI